MRMFPASPPSCFPAAADDDRPATTAMQDKEIEETRPDTEPTVDKVEDEGEVCPTTGHDDDEDEEPEIVTMMDVLKEEEELEENVDAG